MKLIAKAAEDLDVLTDVISVVRVDIATAFLRMMHPPGFWGDNSPSRMFLTFDDGPSPHTTEPLLELLAETNTRATFFLIGQEAQKYPELVRAIHEAGHTIGNHSHTHEYLPTLSTRQIDYQLSRANAAIGDIIGEAPQLFRAPYGMMDERVAKALVRHNLFPVYWTAAPEDWAIPGAARVIRRVNWKLKPGGIIVLHEGKELASQTIPAAKQIIYSCRHRHLELDRVESCLTSNPQRIMNS